MLSYRVGFVEAPLALYRMHTESATASDLGVNRGWLDRLWMLKGALLARTRTGLEPSGPWSHARHDALRQARRSRVLHRRVAQRQFTSSLSAYLRFRSLPSEERSAALHPRLEQEPAPGG